MTTKVTRTLRSLCWLALTTAIAVAPAAAQDRKPGESRKGPVFRADGPNAAEFGLKEGYPRCAGLTYIKDKRCRVGAFSDFGRLFPSRDVAAPATPSPLRRATVEPKISYQLDGKTRTLDDYLNTFPITGFLIAKGETILIERYQYSRTDKHLMAGFSMTKSIVGLLIGMAIEDGAIHSIDDTADVYVPELKGTEFGRTPIKALLQMASGVAFDEEYADAKSDIYTLARLTIEQDPGGSLAAAKRFNTRRFAPGDRFNYSSADTLVLGLVLAKATGRSISDYASEKLWRPLGAEATAKWNIDATGQEITFAYFNAVLRDWARLGLMLAHRGMPAGRRIVPESWIAASTTVGPRSPAPTYGYQIWISPYDRRRFLLSGLRGQYVLIDPTTKMILVQTALDNNEIALSELSALWFAAREQFR